MAQRSNPVLPIVGALALVVVLFFMIRGGGDPHHLVVVRFDPRLARTEAPGTPTPRLDSLKSTGATLTWTTRSDALEAGLDALAERLVDRDWTVQVSNVLDVALENASRAKERGDPGPYFVFLSLAASDRAAVGAAVGRTIDGLAAVLPPAETVFVFIDAAGGSIVAHGPAVESSVGDPEGDVGAVLARIDAWAGL